MRISLLKNRVNLKLLMKELARRGIVNILLEGGGELLTSAVEERLVDRAAFFYAPLLLGGDSTYCVYHGKGQKRVRNGVKLKEVTFEQFDDNILVQGEVSR